MSVFGQVYRPNIQLPSSARYLRVAGHVDSFTRMAAQKFLTTRLPSNISRADLERAAPESGKGRQASESGNAPLIETAACR